MKYGIFCLAIFILASHDLFCQRLKKITAWEKKIDERDSSISNIVVYSRKGYVLEDYIPGFCGHSYKYDKKGRIISDDYTCGESSGNGVTTFHYSRNKTCSYQYASGFTNINCDSFNKEGKIIHRNTIHIDDYDFSDEDYTVAKTFFSYSKGTCKKEEFIRNFSVFEKNGKITAKSDTTTNILITTSFYNEYDSLTDYVVFDKGRNDTIRSFSCSYDPVTRLKKEQIHFPGRVTKLRTVYSYLQGTNLLTEEINYINNDTDSWIIWKYNDKKQLIEKNSYINEYDHGIKCKHARYSYTYIGNQLVRINSEIIIDSMALPAQADFYSGNLIRKSVFYNGEGKPDSYITYYYDFW